MTNPAKPNPPAASNADYFAAERTLLDWVRTGLAMMGFGFVVARFGLFLRELAVVRGHAVEQSTTWSLWFGTLLVVLGVIVNIWSAVGHMQAIGRLNRGERLQFRAVSPSVITAVLLGLLGLAMAIYLAFGLNGSPTPTAATTIAPADGTSKTPATPGR